VGAVQSSFSPCHVMSCHADVCTERLSSGKAFPTNGHVGHDVAHSLHLWKIKVSSNTVTNCEQGETVVVWILSLVDVSHYLEN
jgi:hypothetical protein